MKLLTAITTANHHQRVAAALESTGLTATTVATAEAPGLKPSTRWHRGAKYQDRRCVRLEVLVSDEDVDIVFGLLAPAGCRASGEVIAWSSDVAVPSAPLFPGSTEMSTV